MKKYLLLAAMSMTSMMAAAQPYAEVGFTDTRIQVREGSDEIEGEPQALRLIMGTELRKNISVEGLLATGIKESHVTANGTSIGQINLKLKRIYGAYLKSSIDITPELTGFVRLGVAKTEGELIGVPGIGNASADETSFSYGVGISYAVNPALSVNVDYMSYLDKDDIKVRGVTIGAGYKF